MRNLILILLAFLAIFTYIRAYERTEISPPEMEISVEINH